MSNEAERIRRLREAKMSLEAQLAVKVREAERAEARIKELEARIESMEVRDDE